MCSGVLEGGIPRKGSWGDGGWRGAAVYALSHLQEWKITLFWNYSLDMFNADNFCHHSHSQSLKIKKTTPKTVTQTLLNLNSNLTQTRLRLVTRSSSHKDTPYAQWCCNLIHGLHNSGLFIWSVVILDSFKRFSLACYKVVFWSCEIGKTFLLFWFKHSKGEGVGGYALPSVEEVQRRGSQPNPV